MKIGKKKTATDSFLDKLESEGVHVAAANKSVNETAKVVTPQSLVSLFTPQAGYVTAFRPNQSTFELRRKSRSKLIAMVGATSSRSLA